MEYNTEIHINNPESEPRLAPKNCLIDTRVVSYERVITPNELLKDLPLISVGKQTVKSARLGIESILRGEDKRVLCIVGPCSVHDVSEAKEYAASLRELADKVSDRFLVLMRTYMEKPRTTNGWTGLVYDPDINQTHDINKGLRLGRELLVYAADIGLPCATEYLDPRTPQYTSDAIAWACVGARTTESQPHRHMASGLSMPVGFKNTTNGDIKPAIDALTAAKNPHVFFGMDMDGYNSRVVTAGNQYVHIVLRGGKKSPNYDTINIIEASKMLEKEGLQKKVMIDCSHDNSDKSPQQQVKVFYSIIQSIARGLPVFGIMLESYLEEGSQKIPADLTGFDKNTLLKHKSITDPCISLSTTERIITEAYDELKKIAR